MVKMISISTVLLLAMGSAYAQNGLSTTGPTSTPVSTTTTPTDTDLDGTNNITTDTTTPATTTTIIPATGNVTTTPVTTTPTPITTTPPTTTTPTTNGVITSPTTSTSGTTTTTTSSTSTQTTTTPPAGFACVGTNPSWNLSIAKDSIMYYSVKNDTLKIKPVTPISPAGDTTGNLQVYVAKTVTGKPITILVKKNATGCTNGIVGQNYQYDTFVIFNNIVVTGCCNPA